MRQTAFLALLMLIGLALAAPASAADRRGHHRADRVILTLTEEGWVETETARVRVAVDSAITAEEAAAARGRIKRTLAELVPDVAWRITRFERGRDAAGLERWHVQAEARVPEAGLDGLHERAEALSRPGQQIKVKGVDFTPTVAEREAVRAELRSAIYARAKEELQRLNRVYPHRGFRIRRIDFLGRRYGPERYKRHEMGAEMMAEAAPAPSAPPGPEGVAERMVLRATVVLAATPPGLEKDE